MSMDEIEKLMQQQINENNNVKNSKEIAIAKDAEMKAIEGAYARDMFEYIVPA